MCGFKYILIAWDCCSINKGIKGLVSLAKIWTYCNWRIFKSTDICSRPKPVLYVFYYPIASLSITIAYSQIQPLLYWSKDQTSWIGQLWPQCLWSLLYPRRHSNMKQIASWLSVDFCIFQNSTFFVGTLSLNFFYVCLKRSTEEWNGTAMVTI